jgi:putative transcriptional regulator
MSDKKVTMYGAEWCGDCRRSKKFLDSNNVNYTYVDVEHDEAGTIGFVTNRPFGKSLHELIEFNHSKPFPLMDGGPVDTDHLFVLHKRPDLIDGGKQIPNGLYLGGNMEQVIHAINTGGANPQEIQLFIGYCGWDLGELEAELEETRRN